MHGFSFSTLAGAVLAVGLLGSGAAVTTVAHADLPLTVEDLITDKGKIRLDLSLAYANADRQGLATAEPTIVQTGPTSFITLPTLIGESVGNSDTVVATLGLRYGLTAKAEVYARMSGVASSQRSSGLGGLAKSSESGFADAWVGLNHQFRKDYHGCHTHTNFHSRADFSTSRYPLELKKKPRVYLCKRASMGCSEFYMGKTGS